jgi:dihydrodipicolinate synthase/N-acetylneuraminate lyase
LSVDIVRRLGVELELVQYVKEETDPEMVSSEKLLRACSGVFKGVFTGTGGAWLLWELERGIDGNMPGAPVVDVLVKIWNLWSVGRKAEALELQDRHSAFTKIWEGLPRGARKVILVKRGLITSAVLRNLGEVSLTDLDQAALDHALDILRPHLVQ